MGVGCFCCWSIDQKWGGQTLKYKKHKMSPSIVLRLVASIIASIIMVASIIALFDTPRINVYINSPVVRTSLGRLMMTEHD